MSGFSDLSPEAQRYARRIRRDRDDLEERVKELERHVNDIEDRLQRYVKRSLEIYESESTTDTT